jgi:uncharacterized protein (DUF1697 family)
MNTYISILKGINVSGHNIIKINALQELYKGIGFKNVQTYIQSGNVVFQDTSSDIPNIEKKISDKISESLGLEIPVLVKEVSEFKEISQHNPFLKERNEDINHLAVTFLLSKPSQENIDKISGLNFLPDEFIIRDKAIYLFCPNGFGNSKLTMTFFESKLKMHATTRNWKTTIKLLEMAEKILSENK